MSVIADENGYTTRGFSASGYSYIPALSVL
jgi:hypothetical protein